MIVPLWVSQDLVTSVRVFPPFQIKSSLWDESTLKFKRTFHEVFPPDTVLPSVRLSSSGSFSFLFVVFFFKFCIFLSCQSVIGTLSTELPKKNQNNHLQFLHLNLPRKNQNHLQCQQEFEHNAVILTSHTDVNQFRGFRWRLTDGVHVFLSSSRPSPTQRPVGALIINCIAKKIKNKNPHHSSLKLFKGGPSWETCIHPPPPPTTDYCCFTQRAKTKTGSKSRRPNWGWAAAERRATPREDFTSQRLFIFTSTGAEQRDDTDFWARGRITWLLFSYKMLKPVS